MPFPHYNPEIRLRPTLTLADLHICGIKAVCDPPSSNRLRRIDPDPLGVFVLLRYVFQCAFRATMLFTGNLVLPPLCLRCLSQEKQLQKRLRLFGVESAVCNLSSSSAYSLSPCVHPIPQVDKLRKDNDSLKAANESLRRERQQEKQKALSTYEASGMSYHALNQTVKALSGTKKKLTAEVNELC